MTASLDTGAAPGVLAEVDGELVCTAVEDVTHDVRSFTLAMPYGARLAFEPGQYVTVTVTVDGRPLSRCYSITSPATGPDRFTITVKRVPGGPVSGWLHDHLRPGATLHVAGPLGVFGSTHDASSPLLFLTAGSGITPLVSMARTVVARGLPADIVFVHHARTPADIVFRDELARLGDLHPGIRVVVACEGDADDEAWTGHRGRISADFLAETVPDLAGREVLVCGPPPYRAAARDLVLAAGVDEARFHEESYVLGESTPASAPPAAADVATYTVEFRRSGRTVTCDAATRILDAACEAGLSHPSSCREGVCGTCKTSMLAGSVDMDHGGGIRPREIAAGKVLLCCSTPTDDVVLDA